MNFAIFILTELFCMTVVLGLRRKGAMRPFPDLAIYYLMYMEFVLYLQITGIIDYGFLKLYSSYAFEKNFLEISLYLSAYVFILYMSKTKSKISIDYTDILKNVKLSNVAIITLAVVVYSINAVFLLYLNWDLVWYNETYLLMNTADVVTQESPFLEFIVHMQAPMSLAVAAFLPLLYFQRNRFYSLFIPVALWRLVYMLTSHSRSAALMLGIAAMIALMFKRRGYVIVLGTLTFVALLTALEGRTVPGQGLSTLFDVPQLAYDALKFDFGHVIGNSGEGIFIASEALVWHAQFSPRYMFLSMMPTVSAIDGFGAIIDAEQVRLHYYVPMSAIQEIASFGPIYMIVFFVTQLIAGRLTTEQMNNKPGLASFSINLLPMLGFLLQFAYPCRNVFRFFEYGILASFLI